jgi:chromosome segregation ATPase
MRLRSKRSLAILAVALCVGGVAVKLVADERSQQRDRAFVANELNRVQEMVDRSGMSVSLAAKQISEMHDSFESFRARIANAAAEIESRQTELVALISAHEHLGEQLASLQRELSTSFAEAEGRLALSSERIDSSKMRAGQRQSLTGQVAALRKSVLDRKVEAGQIAIAAQKNTELLTDAQATLDGIAEQRRFADAAANRAAELEERSAERQSRAEELSRKLKAAQREIDSLTGGASR